MASADADGEVGRIIREIQAFVYPRRVRLREFFVDFDPRRSGRCTKMQLSRALSMAGIALSEQEVALLAEHFLESGPRVQKPQDVGYGRLCLVVDEVFAAGGAPASARGTPGHFSPNASQALSTLSFSPNAVADEERALAVLQRLATLCRTRGVALKYCYMDQEHRSPTSPPRQNRTGKVTKSQFLRAFPFKKELSEADLELLVQRYRSPGPPGTSAVAADGDVHFMALHKDVSEAMHSEMPPFPRSDLVLKEDGTEWSHQRLHPVEKLVAKAVERRVRLRESFLDFDPLRKGVCTVGQLKTVLNLSGLAKDLDRLEFDHLAAEYLGSEGLFRYRDFCADVESGFATQHLEKDPLAASVMPDAATTAPARRNRVVLTPTRQEQIRQLEAAIGARKRKTGTNMKPLFRDMDGTLRGHVTRSQFTRVLSMCGFDLSEAQISLLCAAYCDLGNHVDVNYLDFLRQIDPAGEDASVFAAQFGLPPSEREREAPRYFDAAGAVRPMDRVLSPLTA